MNKSDCGVLVFSGSPNQFPKVGNVVPPPCSDFRWMESFMLTSEQGPSGAFLWKFVTPDLSPLGRGATNLALK